MRTTRYIVRYTDVRGRRQVLKTFDERNALKRVKSATANGQPAKLLRVPSER